MEREARLQGILHIPQKPYLSGSPVKEPSPKVRLMESVTERCPTTTTLLRSSIKIPVIQDPPRTRFLLTEKGSPRRYPYPKTFSTYLPGSPVKELPPQAPSMESLQGQRRFIHRAPFIHLSKSPVYVPSSRFPKRGPYGRRCPSPEPFSTYSPGSPAREPSLQVPLTELPQRETLHPESPCQPYLKVPGKGAHSSWPN